MAYRSKERRTRRSAFALMPLPFVSRSALNTIRSPRLVRRTARISSTPRDSCMMTASACIFLRHAAGRVTCPLLVIRRGEVLVVIGMKVLLPYFIIIALLRSSILCGALLSCLLFDMWPGQVQIFDRYIAAGSFVRAVRTDMDDRPGIRLSRIEKPDLITLYRRRKTRICTGSIAFAVKTETGVQPCLLRVVDDLIGGAILINPIFCREDCRWKLSSSLLGALSSWRPVYKHVCSKRADEYGRGCTQDKDSLQAH